MNQARLAPRLRDRVAAAVPGPGWRRAVLIRRLTAGLLATSALVLALTPPPGDRGVPVVVAAADLSAGATVLAGDVAVRMWPSDLAPVGALPDPAAAEGRVLVGAARTGEPLTDVRLAGAVAAGAGPGSAAVPVRLADPGIAEMLVPGRRVDVVGVDEQGGAPVVLAADATVQAVLPAEEGAIGPGPGRLILVTMPRELATRVAAASVADRLAITLR